VGLASFGEKLEAYRVGGSRQVRKTQSRSMDGAGMRSIVVQLPGDGDRGAPRLLELAPGQEATFGRGTDEHPVDICLPDSGVSRLAGRIRAAEDYWLMSNLSRSTTYIVENPEGAGEFVKAAPRRLDMPVPFEFARVVLPAEQGSVAFMVFAPSHAYATAEALERPSGEQTVAAFPLDETAKYFLILVALCEPRLRDSSAVMIPSAPEVVRRLRGLESCKALTRTAVNFHIDYLARTKLRVKQPGEAARADKCSQPEVRSRTVRGVGGTPPGTEGAAVIPGGGTKADWQRAALVSLALRFNLVREEHLGLLPSRLPTRASAAGTRPEGSPR